MKEALAEEPTRVDSSMLRARMFLVTPDQSSDAKFAQRIKNYKWLTGLDAIAIGRLWLPIDGANAEYSDRARATFARLVENVIHSENTNLLGAAADFKDEAAALRRLMKELPDTPAARNAEQRLAQIGATAP